MDHNWDLFILDPIFILLGIAVIIWMFVQERTSLKWILFFGETILYWFVNGLLAKWNANQLNIDQFAQPWTIALMFIGASLFFSIILKPLATFLTGRAHHRRYWMYGSIAATVIGIVLTFLNPADNSAGSIAMFIIIAIMIGMSISANSLYFLFVNEQFYYRVAPVLTATLLSVTTMFGTFVGSWASSLENTFTAQAGNNDYHVALFVIALVFMAISSLLILYNKENPETVRGFDAIVLAELPRYSKKTLIYLMLSTIAISMLYALTQSTLVIDFIRTKLLITNGYNKDVVEPWIRTFGTFYSIPQILFGYFVYKYVTKKLGFKTSLMIMMGTSAVAIVVLVFANNPYLFIFFNLILGLALSQLFYAFFSMAIMWNYRANGIPVTGFVAASNSLGQFIIDTILAIIKKEHVGIYKDFNSDVISNPDQHIEYINHFNGQIDDVTTILFAGIVVILVIAAVWIFFAGKTLFADYLNIDTASSNMKRLVKTDIRQKINTRTNDSVLGKGVQNEQVNK